MCFNCGRPSIYYQTDDGLKLRVCTVEERDSIEAQPDYRAAILTIATAFEGRRGHG